MNVRRCHKQQVKFNTQERVIIIRSYETSVRFRNMNATQICEYKIQKIIVYNSVTVLKKGEIASCVMNVIYNFLISVHVRKAINRIITGDIKIT
jgi:hypothetical protein